MLLKGLLSLIFQSSTTHDGRGGASAKGSRPISDFHGGSRHVGRDPTNGTHRNEHSPMLGKRMGRGGGLGGAVLVSFPFWVRPCDRGVLRSFSLANPLVPLT